VKLPQHLKCARNHPRAVRNWHAHWAAVSGRRLHQPEREVKKRGLQGQRGKQRQQRDDDHSSESKHRFHVCSPEVRWAVQLFAVDNGRSAATSKALKMKDLSGSQMRLSWPARHAVFPGPHSSTQQSLENRSLWAAFSNSGSLAL
jgi:hypothetical protein